MMPPGPPQGRRVSSHARPAPAPAPVPIPVPVPAIAAAPTSRRSARRVLIAASALPDACLRGIARHARERGWHLVTDMLFTGVMPREWCGDGVLALLPRHSETVAHLRALRLPRVGLGSSALPPDLPCVEPDHREIGRLAAEHFLRQPHRAFAWAPSTNDQANRERHEGFAARLAELGRGCHALPPARLAIGGFSLNNWSGHRRRLSAELRRLPRPAAVFAFDDHVAADLIDACRDLGLCVPDDIAVLGVGDTPAGGACPVSLSSIDDDPESLGHRAAELLGALMDGAPPPAGPLRVPPKGLIPRRSSEPAAVDNRHVARALAYIADHYPNPLLTVDEIASAAGMSRRHLERCFRESAGRSINEHIVGLRMREASRILRMHPRTRSSEVATLVGIAGAGTFSRAFRRFFGVSPLTHREWSEPTHADMTTAGPLRSRPRDTGAAEARAQ